MKLEKLMDTLLDTFENAKPAPFSSSKIIIDEDEVAILLEDMRREVRDMAMKMMKLENDTLHKSEPVIKEDIITPVIPTSPEGVGAPKPDPMEMSAMVREAQKLSDNIRSQAYENAAAVQVKTIERMNKMLMEIQTLLSSNIESLEGERNQLKDLKRRTMRNIETTFEDE